MEGGGGARKDGLLDGLARAKLAPPGKDGPSLPSSTFVHFMFTK